MATTPSQTSERATSSSSSSSTPRPASPRAQEHAQDSQGTAQMSVVGVGADATDANDEPTFTNEDYVTVLLVHQYRDILEGRQRRNATVFIGAKDHGVITFRGGFARDVPYTVAAEWRRLPQYRGALKIIANDTPEALYAQKVGMQPRHASIIAAEMEASDLDNVIAQMTPAMRAKLRRLLEAQ